MDYINHMCNLWSNLFWNKRRNGSASVGINKNFAKIIVGANLRAFLEPFCDIISIGNNKEKEE